MIDPIENKDQGIFEILSPELSSQWRWVKTYRTCEKLAGYIPFVGVPTTRFFASLRQASEIHYEQMDQMRS